VFKYGYFYICYLYLIKMHNIKINMVICSSILYILYCLLSTRKACVFEQSSIVYVYEGKQPSLMAFRMGSDGVNMTNNALSYLNDSSAFQGSVRRWYCHGSCTGRFASVKISGSSLATLKGCVLRIFQWIRKSFGHQLLF